MSCATWPAAPCIDCPVNKRAGGRTARIGAAARRRGSAGGVAAALAASWQRWRRRGSAVGAAVALAAPLTTQWRRRCVVGNEDDPGWAPIGGVTVAARPVGGLALRGDVVGESTLGKSLLPYLSAASSGAGVGPPRFEVDIGGALEVRKAGDAHPFVPSCG